MYFFFTNQMKSNVEPEEIEKIISQHISWAKQKIKTGKLLQVGKWGESGGAGIIKAQNRDEATDILKEDPLIHKNFVDYKLDVFYPDVPLE